MQKERKYQEASNNKLLTLPTGRVGLAEMNKAYIHKDKNKSTKNTFGK